MLIKLLFQIAIEKIRGIRSDTNIALRAVQFWAWVHGAKWRNGKLVLYKWAAKNGETRNGVRYVEGQMVEAPDWNPDPRIECGVGLHACASLDDAKEFVFYQKGGLAVELLVDPKDCRPPHPRDYHPTKIRFRRAFVTRVWDADRERKISWRRPFIIIRRVIGAILRGFLPL